MRSPPGSSPVKNAGDPLVARIVRLIDEGDGGFYAGDLRHQAADFTELHAIAADFDLRVEAPEELNLTVRQAARPIAAAVQALAADVRRSDKTFGGQLRGVQVAARQAGAADAKLASSPSATGCSRSSRMKTRVSAMGRPIVDGGFCVAQRTRL